MGEGQLLLILVLEIKLYFVYLGNFFKDSEGGYKTFVNL